MKLLRQPLLHFLLLGGMLFAASHAWQPQEPIVVDEATVQQLRADWQRETGRQPTAEQLQASLNRQVDEERLLREALRLDLDARDAVARRRLVSNMRFALADENLDEGHALEVARKLDMPARDIVVRRRLAQVMEQRLLQQQLPPEQELRDYVASHPQRYAQDARYAFEQRYFSGDARGMGAAMAAAAQALKRQPSAPHGEPFLLGESFPAIGQRDIAARFGAAFAQSVATSQGDAWFGPVASTYGAHLVRVTRRDAAQAPDYAAVRARAAYAWLAENEPRRLREALAPLRVRYRVQLAPAVLAQGLSP